MFFESLQISNFGPFFNLKCKFSPGRINLISGFNGSGRTQIGGCDPIRFVGNRVR